MTAVIYARYSTDSQREESIEGQIRECTAYAEKNGFTVVKHYIDRAVSAKTDNRPQFQQMIKDSERGIFDVIIVWCAPRQEDNEINQQKYLKQPSNKGHAFPSVSERQGYVGDALCCSIEYNCESFSPVQYGS